MYILEQWGEKIQSRFKKRMGANSQPAIVARVLGRQRASIVIRGILWRMSQGRAAGDEQHGAEGPSQPGLTAGDGRRSLQA